MNVNLLILSLIINFVFGVIFATQTSALKELKNLYREHLELIYTGDSIVINEDVFYKYVTRDGCKQVYKKT